MFPPFSRGSTVKRKSNNAHQLFGAAGSHPGSQITCQAQVQDFDSTENLQYYGSGIHKQSRRYSLQQLSLPDKESMDVVPGETHTHNSPVPSWVPEHSC